MSTSPETIAWVISLPLPKARHSTGTPSASSYASSTCATWFAVGHSRKYATVTVSCAAAAPAASIDPARSRPPIRPVIFSLPDRRQRRPLPRVHPAAGLRAGRRHSNRFRPDDQRSFRITKEGGPLLDWRDALTRRCSRRDRRRPGPASPGERPSAGRSRPAAGRTDRGAATSARPASRQISGVNGASSAPCSRKSSGSSATNGSISGHRPVRTLCPISKKLIEMALPDASATLTRPERR